MTATTRQERRDRFAAKVGPHMQASEIRTVEVPAQPGVAAHKSFLVTATCGREVQTTLATRQAGKVRCPNCKAALDA